MSALRVLLFSDEASLISEAAREALKGFEYQFFDDTEVTRNLATMQQIRGFAIDVAPAEDIPDRIRSRVALGLEYEAYALYSLRVWQIGKTLLSMAKAIRGSEVCSVNGLRMSQLPIAVMNPVNMLNHIDGRKEPLHELMRLDYVSCPQRDEQFANVLIRLIGDWQSEFVTELEYVGPGIWRDDDGHLRVDGAFRRPLHASRFLCEQANVQRLAASGFFKVGKSFLGIEEALSALEEALQQSERATPKQREPLLQACLEKYPILLTQGLYETHWPRKHLRHPDPLRGDVIPDYLLAPSAEVSDFIHPAVVELKSPEFRVKSARRASKELMDALRQLGDRYREYFDDVRTAPVQRAELGRVLVRPQLMLIIGRSRWVQDWIDIRELQRNSDHNDIRIINYDELADISRHRAELHSKLQFRLRYDLRKGSG